jgi:hypothetical protein
MPTELDEIIIDATDPKSLGTWWADVLGWRARADADGDLVVEPPPAEPGVPLLFCRVPEPGAGSHRVHLDLRSRSEQEQAELVARIEATGGRRIDVGQRDVPWVVLADLEAPVCACSSRARSTWPPERSRLWSPSPSPRPRPRGSGRPPPAGA